MINYRAKQDRGFIALITAVIISAILLLISINLSLTGFYSRSNILDFELKETSSNIAEACVDVAILKIINNSNYSPADESVNISENKCIIESVTDNLVIIKSDYKNYITKLEVEIDPSDMSIKRWEEI